MHHYLLWGRSWTAALPFLLLDQQKNTRVQWWERIVVFSDSRPAACNVSHVYCFLLREKGSSTTLLWVKDMKNDSRIENQKSESFTCVSDVSLVYVFSVWPNTGPKALTESFFPDSVVSCSYEKIWIHNVFMSFVRVLLATLLYTTSWIHVKGHVQQ